jgi:hypothetical protein
MSLTHRPRFSSQQHYFISVSGTHYWYSVSTPQGLVRLDGQFVDLKENKQNRAQLTL